MIFYVFDGKIIFGWYFEPTILVCDGPGLATVREEMFGPIMSILRFEDEAEALGNPSEETIYFDKDLSWELEVNQFIDYILDDKPVLESNSIDAYNAMELVHWCYQDSDFAIYQSETN